MIRGYKVRLFPTKEQMGKINQNIGASRFIWNYMLDANNKLYEENKDKEGEKKNYSHFDMCYLIPPLKKTKEYEWLATVDSQNLRITCKDLSLAFQRFFKKQGGYPKFKAKNFTKPSYPTNPDSVNFYEDYISLPKVGKVRYQTKVDFPLGNKACKMSNTRITITTNNKVILSFGMEVPDIENKSLTDSKMGIDLGIKDLAIVANGDDKIVFHNINKSKEVRNLERKLKHLQRNVSRKYEHLKKEHKTWEGVKKYIKENGEPKNLTKEKKKVALLYAHLTNIRDNYLHHVTHTLVELYPERITLEDLNVSGMMKNKHRSKAVAQQKFYEFRRMIEYKCQERGIEVQFADRWYPSSKTCHNCGHIKKDLEIKDRTYVCPVCGYVEDRDYNAALNLRDYSSNQQ